MTARLRTVCVIRIEEASVYHTNRPCIQSFCIEKQPFQSLLLRSDSSKRKKAVYISEMKTTWRMFQKAPMQHRKPGQRYPHWANVGPKLDQPSFTWAERKPLFLVTAGWTPKIHGLVYCVEFLTPLLTRVFIEQESRHIESPKQTWNGRKPLQEHRRFESGHYRPAWRAHLLLVNAIAKLNCRWVYYAETHNASA